jgi:hypothetical protein
VALTLKGGGLMDVVRYANGEGRTIRLERNVPGQSAVPGKSILIGQVSGFGNGKTKFDSITGTSGIQLQGFTNPPFEVGTIAADVVDRLLDEHGSLLTDSIIRGVSRKAKNR